MLFPSIQKPTALPYRKNSCLCNGMDPLHRFWKDYTDPWGEAARATPRSPAPVLFCPRCQEQPGGPKERLLQGTGSSPNPHARKGHASPLTWSTGLTHRASHKTALYSHSLVLFSNKPHQNTINISSVLTWKWYHKSHGLRISQSLQGLLAFAPSLSESDVYPSLWQLQVVFEFLLIDS